MYEKSFSLIFVVWVKSYDNFGSSNLGWPPMAREIATKRTELLIDLVSNFQKVKAANEYELVFSNSLIIHRVRTKEITTVKEV